MKRETVLDVTLLRLHLANKTIPEEGLFRAEELFALNFDYSNESLEQINQLLGQLYLDEYRPEHFVNRASHSNFLMMIAIYLCDTISYRTGEKNEWFNYYEATARLPKEYMLPPGFFSSMVAIINHQVCLPFLVIEDLLSAPHENSRNCVNYVAERCISISKTKINNPNELCKEYLTALEQHKIIPGGNFYKTATDCIVFDYSIRSIEEVDRLLFCIREHEQLSAKDYENFIQQPDKANFLLLIGFYLGMSIARHSRLPIQWYNFQDYLKQFSRDKKLKYRFDTHHVFSMGNQLYYPLQFLKEFLFTEQIESMSCLEYIELGIPKQIGFIQRYPQKMNMPVLPKLISSLQRKVFFDAGSLAAYAMYMVLDNDHYVPTISLPSNDGPSHLHRLQSNVPELEGLDMMQNNPHQKSYQIYSEDGYAYLDTGRTDAIRIDIRCYVGQHFKLSIVVPYQAHHSHYAAQIFNAVRYSATALSNEQVEAGMQEFYEGAFQFVSPLSHKVLWQEFFHEQLIPTPDPAPASKDFLLIQQRRFKKALSDIQPSQFFKNRQSNQGESSLYHNPFQNIKIQDEILRLPAKYRSYLQVNLPQWMIGDELYKQILAMPTLYQSGRVVWGCLVHTQEIMHHPGDEHCDGEIVYDPTGRTDPLKLFDLAQRLYRLKDTKAQSPDQFRYIQHLNTEISRISDYPYPESLSDLPLRISSIWFCRNHLPNGMLCMPYFPILISDNEKYRGQCMVLPAWFWPKELRNEWLNISSKRLGKQHDLAGLLMHPPKHAKISNDFPDAVPSLDLIYQEFELLSNKQHLMHNVFKTHFSHLPSLVQAAAVSVVAVVAILIAVAV